VRYREVLAALRACDGRAIAVTEEEIRTAHHRLARAGLLVEPTSAVAAAAALRYRRTPEGDGTRVAVILTGMGLKALSGDRPV
jgi:threonine synthase